jgi:hypothetical protein
MNKAHMRQANLFLPQSHIVPYRLPLRTIKLMIPQRQQGWVTGVIVLMSSVKSSQNQPFDTETNDTAIARTAVAAAGAPIAAEPPEAATVGSMGDNVEDNALPGSAADNAAQAPTGK